MGWLHTGEKLFHVRVSPKSARRFFGAAPQVYHRGMSAHPWYPVYLNLLDQPVLVIGAGKVALRKTRGLLEAGARVTVVSPRFHPEFEGLAIHRVQREFEPADLEGARLVFAATNARKVNQQAGELARTRGIPANIADAPGECGFFVPARINREDVQIAISTGGQSPSRAAGLRRKLEEWLDLMRP
jgi:precorrin-2 dehydrogenase / sirohydrochlorin ferrochelatase